MRNRLRAFQLRGLRQILRIRTTFVNRSNTNSFVLRQANAILLRHSTPETRAQKQRTRTPLQQRILKRPIVRGPPH